MRSRIGTALVAALLMMVAIPVAWAQSTLDAPEVTTVTPKAVSIRLMVTAGASGAPAGFELQWMQKADFTALGAWPEPGHPLLRVAYFEGFPTFNITGTSRFYGLLPGRGIEVELGQLFDETGVRSNTVEELDPSTDYVVRVRATAYSTAAASAFREYTFRTQAARGNCTYSFGSWKGNPGMWPVLSLTLGTVTYSSAQLMDILKEPARGNGLVLLAHQLITAKLNIANGADPSAVASTIAAADQLIGSLVIPPIGDGYLHPTAVNSLANGQDDFNNGLVGPANCGTVPAGNATWGSVKHLYR